jgi:hypothetical protein
MGAAKQDNEYGLIRINNKEDGSLAWIVNFKRRGRLINRYFADAIFGGADAALDAARAYRDAVIRAFPPLTTRESAQRIRSNNRSGVSGVVKHNRFGQHYGWSVVMEDGDKRRTKLFSFSRYGEEAFERAVECRQEWIAAKQARFLTANNQGRRDAQIHFAELLEQDIDDTTLEGFTAKLKTVDDAFHASFPRYIYVSAKIVVPTEGKQRFLRGRVASSVFAKSFEPVVSFTERSLAECLVLMKSRIEVILQTQCAKSTMQAFFDEHDDLFTEQGFDPNKGFSVRTMIIDRQLTDSRRPQVPEKAG